MRRRTFLIGVAAALGACASTPSEPVPTPNFYVMRHLHTVKGASDPDLTPEGTAAAEALAAWLSRDPPRAIFVSNTKRALQTATPTATRYGVALTTYDPRDTPGLIASVSALTGTVLIVGHSNTVADIVAGLGGEKPGPLVHEDFGDVWRVYGTPRTTVRSKLP